jgi:hypothetical protein
MKTGKPSGMKAGRMVRAHYEMKTEHHKIESLGKEMMQGGSYSHSNEHDIAHLMGQGGSQAHTDHIRSLKDMMGQ